MPTLFKTDSGHFRGRLLDRVSAISQEFEAKLQALQEELRRKAQEEAPRVLPRELLKIKELHNLSSNGGTPERAGRGDLDPPVITGVVK